MNRLHHGHSYLAGILTALAFVEYRVYVIVAAAFVAGAVSAMLAGRLRGMAARLGVLFDRLAGRPKGLPW